MATTEIAWTLDFLSAQIPKIHVTHHIEFVVQLWRQDFIVNLLDLAAGIHRRVLPMWERICDFQIYQIKLRECKIISNVDELSLVLKWNI